MLGMDASKRLKAALQRCTVSAREIAAELTRRNLKVSHTTVNRWFKGEMPRLDQAAALADIAGLDLNWILFGEGPAPWELTDEDRRILWLVGVVGYDEAVSRLAVADPPPEGAGDGSFSAAARRPIRPRKKGPA
jgi:hypothetical protein